MMMFTVSRVLEFRHDPQSGLRYGQAFHQFFHLERVTSLAEKVWCDKLYNEPDDSKAKAMVRERTDVTQ